MVRRAALALDLGRVAVSNAIWETPGPFGLTDWERAQLHPYFTERSFAHAPALASLGELAGAHHERLDGAGYHRTTSSTSSTRRACEPGPPRQCGRSNATSCISPRTRSACAATSIRSGQVRSREFAVDGRPAD